MKTYTNSLLTVLYSLLLLSSNALNAQWQSYNPTLPDIVGAYDLRIAHGNDQVAWCVAMKYAVTSSEYEWLPAPTLFFTKTGDGGATWSGGTIPMGTEPYASNICPVSEHVAWVSGLDADFSSYILRTQDGGATWERFLEDQFTDGSAYVDFVHFWDEQNGIVMGDPTPSDTDPVPHFEIYRTTDGGTTWQRVPSANIPDNNGEFGEGGGYEVHGDHVWFNTLDPVTFFSKRIYHSSDRGQTWEVLDPPGNQFVFWSFSDALHGMTAIRPVSGQPNVLINYTDDGGATWTELPPYVSPEPGSDYILIPQSHFILTTRRANNISGPFYTYLSKDKGETWQQIASGENVAALDFSSPGIGYGGELQPANHPTRMYKYTGSPLTGLFANRSLNAEVILSPNPTSDFLEVTIQADQASKFILLLNDAQGQLIERKDTDKCAQTNVRFEFKNLPAGIYTVTVSSENGHLTRKVIKD